jgi:hypothetical protein
LFRDGHPTKVLTTEEQGAIRFIFSADGKVNAQNWTGENWE